MIFTRSDMAQAYLDHGKTGTAVFFELFVRNVPAQKRTATMPLETACFERLAVGRRHNVRSATFCQIICKCLKSQVFAD